MSQMKGIQLGMIECRLESSDKVDKKGVFYMYYLSNCVLFNGAFCVFFGLWTRICVCVDISPET